MMNYINLIGIIMKDNYLILIPKCEKYIEYMINVINKLPRVEKFNIGNNLKDVMYKFIENIVYLNKVKDKLVYCNYIDSQILIQRIYIRIMFKNRYIDEKKYNISISMLDEIGRIIGGYIRYIKL